MPKKILTIDDDPYIVKYITEVLSDNGYATCSASSVEEALSVLEAERPDLVTLDMEMPDEWGPRFYRKMSMNPAFKDTPVRASTSPSATPWPPSRSPSIPKSCSPSSTGCLSPRTPPARPWTGNNRFRSGGSLRTAGNRG